MKRRVASRAVLARGLLGWHHSPMGQPKCDRGRRLRLAVTSQPIAASGGAALGESFAALGDAYLESATALD